MQRRPQRSRFGGARGGGQIVEVEGGHIVRSTGRKDRHSKVCTAKGTRDRRVRLSAHTAIQFYDVQDRLGYDRPSKAVDWLIKNAKEAIDELAELPAWHPTTTSATAIAASDRQGPQRAGDSGKRPMAVAEHVSSAAFGYGGESSSGAFLPPSLDSDAIADTIKSFFPIAAAATAAAPSSSPRIGYQNYTQDLRLSLHSFQDSIFQQSHPNHHPIAPTQHAIFSSFNLASASWPEQSQRMAHWSSPETSSSGHGGGYMFNVPTLPPPQAVPLHPMLGQGHFFTQREPLQSNSPSIRAALAEPVPTFIDHMAYHALHPSASSIGFASGGGFSGFRVPARIQGDDEEHDGISDKPSSASSTSHH